MSFSVNTNNNAMTAIRLLNQTNSELSTVQERINSGLRVGSAKDDASSFSIAQGMRGDIGGFKAIRDSLSFGEAVTNVALSAAETISDTLNEMKAKVVQAQERSVDRDAIQQDIQALNDQINSIAQAAQFNGVNLLESVATDDLKVLSSLNRTSPTAPPTPTYITVADEDLTAAGLGTAGMDVTNKSVELKFNNTLKFADGKLLNFVVNVPGGGTKTITFEFVDDLAADTLTDADHIAVEYDAALSANENLATLVQSMNDNGLTAVFGTGGNIEVSSVYGMGGNATSDLAGFVGGVAAGGDPTAALTTIENAINAANEALSRLGTSVNQLDTQASFVDQLTDELEAGVGALVDADMAEESAKLQALQTREQLGIQALSIANEAPGSVLALFQ